MRARGSSDYFDLQHHGCTPVSCGLLLPPDLTLEDWAAIGHALGSQQQALQWRIGDWWNHPGHAYGDRLAVVTEDEWTGPAYSTCTNVASVCDKFETSRRRELLTFSHHSEVAHLPPHFADELLTWCEEPLAATGKPRSIRALREEKSRRLAQLAPRTFNSVGSERVAVAFTIVPRDELASEYALLPLPASPHHEPEIRQQLGEVAVPLTGPIVEFKAFLRYAEARLPADAPPAMLTEAVEFTKKFLAGLTKRQRRSGGGGDDKVVVNLR